MRPQKVENKELMEGLISVIRAKGYDGASLNDLSASSGLKKASLYHRFPGGKKEITEMVLAYVATWVENNITTPLTNSNVKPEDRLTTALKNINTLYDQGNSICLFRALTMETGMELFGKQVADGLKKWIAAFRELGIDFGYNTAEADKMAQEVLVKIQGSLIIAKGLGTVKPFQESMAAIEKMYMKS